MNKPKLWNKMNGYDYINNECNQANRAISTGKLHILLYFHIQPINVVVFHDSNGEI